MVYYKDGTLYTIGGGTLWGGMIWGGIPVDMVYYRDEIL